MKSHELEEEAYHRYHIETKKAPHIIPHPYRFKVKVNRLKLAKLLLNEMVHYRGKMDVVASRPCVYGVFSGPIGGFAPREELCVGCLRCTTQYPDMVEVSHNPEYSLMGDDFFTAPYVDTVTHEAENGRVPIKGAGYRGVFGGSGWDGMWTDMSEIVRPTRDGIHGREYISTEIDIGEKLPFLTFSDHQIVSNVPKTVAIPLPILFDSPPKCLQDHKILAEILAKSAHELKTYCFLPLAILQKLNIREMNVIPQINPNEWENLDFKPVMLELMEWDEDVFQKIQKQFPETIVILRTGYGEDLLSYYQKGVRVFHLIANYHGKESGKFVTELIRDVHLKFVQEGLRDQVSLIGSGGIIAAEHLPKAIILGLDAVAIDTTYVVALQGHFKGNCVTQNEAEFKLPKKLKEEWGVQRLKNLANSWRDQLFEILGAMGLREVRRMRGEIGRALFQKNLEKEAFMGIKGYDASR